MLDLNALLRVSEPQPSWMQSRWGKGASILTRAAKGWKKTRVGQEIRLNRKDRDYRELCHVV